MLLHDAPVARLDFDDPEFQTDPWPTYDWHLRNTPVHWSEPLRSFFVFRFADAKQILVSSDFVAYHPFRRSRSAFGTSVLDTDGAFHARLRGGLAEHLRPRVVGGYADQFVTPIVEPLLDKLLADRRADFGEVIAHTLPLQVACRILGLDEQDAPWLAERLRPLLQYIDHAPVNVADVGRCRRELVSYLERSLADGHTSPGVLHMLAADSRLTETEALNQSVLFLAAATENTMSAIGNLLARVGSEPGVLEQVRETPDWATAVVLETLRHEPPQHVTTRYAAKDVEIAGTPIPRGTSIQVCLASANRDPEVYEEPARWNPDRPRNTPLTFGIGRHHCLGSGLAQIELETVLHTLADRLATLTVVAPLPAKPSGRTFRTVAGLRLSYQLI